MAENTITPEFVINTTYRLHIDDVEAFKVLASRMATTATKRDGCVFLKVAQDIDDSTTFHLFEGWRDQDAIDAHGASDAFQGIMQEAGKLRIADRFGDTYAVSDRMPLDMPS